MMIMPVPLGELKEQSLGLKNGRELARLLFELSGLPGIGAVRDRLKAHNRKRDAFESQDKGREEKKGMTRQSFWQS
jgi:hypothetical protein